MPVNPGRVRVLTHAEKTFAAKNIRKIQYIVGEPLRLYLRSGVVELDESFSSPFLAEIVYNDEGKVSYFSYVEFDEYGTVAYMDTGHTLRSIKLRSV